MLLKKIFRRKYVLLFISLLIIVGLAVFYFAYSGSEGTYVMAKEEFIEQRIYASGIVKAERYIVIRSDVSGYVSRVYVREGERVRDGQLLAELDPSHLYPQLNEIEKKLRQLYEKADENSYYRTQMIKQLEMAELEVINLEQKYKRRAEMFREGLISKEDLEDIELKFNLAKKNYERLKNLYIDSIKNIHEEIEIYKEKRKKIKEDLKKYQIKAPIEGYIVKRFINRGDYINHIFGENKLFILGSEAKYIEIEIASEYINLIKKGQRVLYKLDGDNVFCCMGEIVDIEKEIDPAKRTIKIKVRSDNVTSLLPNQGIEAQILVGMRKAVIIPYKAIDKKGYVEVKGRGKVRVKLGKKIGDNVEILDGLKAGEYVKIL